MFIEILATSVIIGSIILYIFILIKTLEDQYSEKKIFQNTITQFLKDKYVRLLKNETSRNPVIKDELSSFCRLSTLTSDPEIVEIRNKLCDGDDGGIIYPYWGDCTYERKGAYIFPKIKRKLYGYTIPSSYPNIPNEYSSC